MPEIRASFDRAAAIDDIASVQGKDLEITKKGDKMAFLVLADLKDTIEMVAFPDIYNEQKELFQVGMCLAIKGKLSIRNDEPSIIVDRAKALAPAAS